MDHDDIIDVLDTLTEAVSVLLDKADADPAVIIRVQNIERVIREEMNERGV